MEQFFQSYQTAAKISVIFLCFAVAFISFKLLIHRNEMRSKYRELVDKYDATYILLVHVSYSFESFFREITGKDCCMIITGRKIIFISDAVPDYQLSIDITRLMYWAYVDSESRFFLYFNINDQICKGNFELELKNDSFNKYAMKQNNFFDYLKANYPPPPKVEKNL